MRMFSNLIDPALIQCLRGGGVVVIPTDTLYGVVARAGDEQAVERVYRVRGRAPEKPCIILVADPWQITDTAAWQPVHWELAKKYWPGPLSLIAPTTVSPLSLHRGTRSLAYRVPAEPMLRQLLSHTGPLIAPSANPQGQPPAATLAEAQAYFGDTVDGYVDGGDLGGSEPSTIVRVVNRQVEIVRQGAVKLNL